MQANRTVSAKAERAELRAHKQQVQTLQRKLRRNEKALAETVALLVLEKKVRALFVEHGDKRSP